LDTTNDSNLGAAPKNKEYKVTSQLHLTNDLTPAIEEVWKKSSMPDLKSLYYLLDQFSSYYAFTGSGPTIFAFISDEKYKDTSANLSANLCVGSVGGNFDKYLSIRSQLQSLSHQIIEIDNPFI